jgi:hypothetical protein
MPTSIYTYRPFDVVTVEAQTRTLNKVELSPRDTEHPQRIVQGLITLRQEG